MSGGTSPAGIEEYPLTKLSVEPYEIPSANLGPENPLPVFRAESDDREVNADGSLSEEDRRYLGWGVGYRVLPHRMQDGYDREKRPRRFAAIILENECLRVTVLPEVDGRIASIVHKPTCRELLERNPVFQPANLALRGAWISGGIEWNTCLLGHYYLTCSPVFAARVEGPDGEPALRIYEWDRVKCFPWQVDLVLSPGSPLLFARVRIVNPHDHDLPMYWWTNIAVPEKPGHRTLAPAETAIYNHSEGLRVSRVGEVAEHDASYATNHPYSREMFFRIPDGHRKWIATLDESGVGLVQASTDRLRGRKMFVWGMSQGGRRWQEYLAAPGSAYIEIQAGLARTQMESVPMPARAEWSWTEAYGLLNADPKQVHAAEWDTAWRSAESALDEALPQSRLDQIHLELASVTSREVDDVLASGSGWGALERARVSAQGQDDHVPRELVFDESTLGPDQHPWLALLGTGRFPEREGEALAEPGHYMVQPEWRLLLEDSVLSGRSDHWLAWLHLGVMRLEARDVDGAREAWRESLARRATSWALRNLAVIESDAGRHESARDLLRTAWETGPRVAHLAIEYLQALTRLQSFAEVVEFVRSLPEETRDNERVHVMWAKACIELGELDALDGFFNREFARIREGEVTLTELWFALHEKILARADGVPVDAELRERARKAFPPPRHIDFRMSDRV